MELSARVADFIDRHRLLRPGERVVCGVSGGGDSLCLLDCLDRLGYDVRVAHVDHRLRPESAAEAALTAAVARQYGRPFLREQVDVRAEAGAGGSLEEAARRVRYRSLARMAREQGAGIIATGHTADDQAETILMHLLRGAGPEGLRGMLPSTDLASWVDLPDAAGLVLVRPLLELTRAETQAHCAAIGLTPAEDASNLDPSFFRNRLRHQLLPLLETYNPAIRQILLRTGRIMAAESELVAGLVEKAWRRLARIGEDGSVRLLVAAFLNEPESIQRGLLRRLILCLRPSLRDIGWEAVERGREFVVSPPRTRTADLLAGLQLVHLGSQVVLADGGAMLAFPELPQLTGPDPQAVPVPGQVPLSAGWMLEARQEHRPEDAWVRLRQSCHRMQIAVDADALPGRLMLRPPQPGDRLQPMGMQGSVKISDLLVNDKVPRPARPRWPILTAGPTPVWVLGVRVASCAPLLPDTRRAVVFQLVPPG